MGLIFFAVFDKPVMNSQVVRRVLQAGASAVPKRASSSMRAIPLAAKDPVFTLEPELKAHIHPKIGAREIVGYGIRGDGTYEDHLAFPGCAIRFQEPSSANAEIREKEKGDWKVMSIDEKKALYRYSFCQTYSEMNADRNTGEWKKDVGNTIALFGVCCLGWIWMKYFFSPPLDYKEEPAFRKLLQRRMLDEYYNPIFGTSHDWDYEKLCWKEFNTPKIY